MSRLVDKVAIVTGGAQGIGQAISEVFAENGACVAILDWNAEKGEATAAGIQRASNRATFVECDVSDEPSVERAVERAVSEFGALHVLVNNAAVFAPMKGIEATPDDWQRILAVNVIGPALMAKHAVPHIRHAGGGAIVNPGRCRASSHNEVT